MKNSLIIDREGTKNYYLNGLFHRLDGPAIESVHGYKSWFQHGNLHRLDGPAVEAGNSYKSWYFHGKYIPCHSQEEFEEKIAELIFS
jgi:hypothetical protein